MQPIRLLRDSRTIDTALRAVLPARTADGIVRATKYLLNPKQLRVRTDAVNRIRAEAAEVDGLRRDGFVRFARGRFREAEAAVEAAGERFELLAAAGELEAMRARGSKDFLVRPAEDGDFAKTAVLRLAVSRPLIDLASAYLGRIPLLSNIQLWWSPVNDSMAKSQLFHRDAVDSNQLKFMFNIREIGPDSGPFTLIPARESTRVMAELNYSQGRLADESVARAGGLEHAIALTGEKGAGFCCDTFRCLHFGSRGNCRDRLILMIKFVDYLAARFSLPPWHEHFEDEGLELDEVQRLVLGVR